MNRANLSRMVQFLTGHNQLKRHKNIQDGVIDLESCRLCFEEEESSYHVFADCPALQKSRLTILQQQIIRLEDLAAGKWTVEQVNKFLDRTPIGEMLDNSE